MASPGRRFTNSLVFVCGRVHTPGGAGREPVTRGLTELRGDFSPSVSTILRPASPHGAPSYAHNVNLPLEDARTMTGIVLSAALLFGVTIIILLIGMRG